jgi:hypothetical protein
MKLIIKFLAVAILFSGVSSCYDDTPPPPVLPNPNVVFKATLSGAQEVPAGPSAATGQANLVFDSISKIMILTVTHTVPNPTNGHIHKAAVGVSGPVVFPFATFTSPIHYVSPKIDAAQEADLKSNLYYVNIHTAAYPAGEIRGQLIRQ